MREKSEKVFIKRELRVQTEQTEQRFLELCPLSSTFHEEDFFLPGGSDNVFVILIPKFV